MMRIPDRIAFVSSDPAARARAAVFGVPVMTPQQLVAQLEAGDAGEPELTAADVDRVNAANGKLFYPPWVEAELRARDAHVHFAGEVEVVNRDDPVGLVVSENAERWARIAGAETGDILTAWEINRGKLIELLHREMAR